MNFKIGDKLRFKTKPGDWNEYMDAENLGRNMEEYLIADAKDYEESFGSVIVVTNSCSGFFNPTKYVEFVDKNGKKRSMHVDWVTHLEESEQQISYEITQEGFKTNPNNWKNGLGLI